MTILGDIFDLRERARVQGYFSAMWGLFGLIGPMLGGLIVDALSWRWIFFVNIPLCLASAALIIVYLHEEIEKRHHHLDFFGAALLASGMSALLLGASRLGPHVTMAAVPSAAVLLTVFFFAERRAIEPMVDFSLFARPVILLSSIVGALMGGAMLAISTYVPFYAQGALQLTPLEVGSAITPMVITWPIAAILSGRLIPKLGFRLLIRLGIGLIAVSGGVLALFGSDAGLGEVRLVCGAFGLGMGFANTALVLAVQTSVRWEQRGIATASTMFVRTIGGALAVAVIGGVQNAWLNADPSVPADAASKLLSREGLRDLDTGALRHLAAALHGFFGAAFWIIAGLAISGFLATLFFPYVPLADRGGRASLDRPIDAPTSTTASRPS